MTSPNPQEGGKEQGFLPESPSADAGPSPRSPEAQRSNAHVSVEAAVVYRAGRRRFFTRNAAVREAARHIVRQFMRLSGDDGMEADVYQELVNWLVERIEAGEPVTAHTVDEYFNPHRYPDGTEPDDRASSRDEGGLRDEPENPALQATGGENGR